MEQKNIPSIKEKYFYFDDGKIKESRKKEVIIKEIISFKDVDKNTLEIWKKEINQCDWLYSKTTDYFIKAFFTSEEDKEIIFVRTLDNGWFSLGWWGGELDVTGELNDQLNNVSKNSN